MNLDLDSRRYELPVIVRDFLGPHCIAVRGTPVVALYGIPLKINRLPQCDCDLTSMMSGTGVDGQSGRSIDRS